MLNARSLINKSNAVNWPYYASSQTEALKFWRHSFQVCATVLMLKPYAVERYISNFVPFSSDKRLENPGME